MSLKYLTVLMPAAGLVALAAEEPAHAGLVFNKMCKPAERTAVSDAFSAARPIAKAAVAALEPKNFPKSKSAYETWFGKVGQARLDRVRDIYARTLAFAEARQTLTIECNTPKKCKPSTYAYVYPDTPDVVTFCGAFFDKKTPARYGDSRAGTFIHEVTHFFGTDDHEYGEVDAKELARKNPDKATDNADNFQYFADWAYGRGKTE